MTAPAEHWLEGKYELLGKIGQGGMGAVYKARHRLLDEVRVIKVLRSDQADREELQQRFQQEARTAIRLKHPGIAQLHDFALADDGTAFIVMEFIEGVALDVALATCGRLSPAIAVELCRQALEALDYLHRQGYVHRDIAPDNLMLCRGLDGRPLLKIIDLGIARHVGSGTSLTSTGSFVGKVRYSSPEQFTDSREVDARSDVYSFGLILYEMVTGKHPLPGETFQVMAASHLFTEPRKFSESDPENLVPEELREIILRVLAKKPDDRFSSAAALGDALAALELPTGADDAALEAIFAAAMAARPEIETAGSTDQNQLDEGFQARDKTGGDPSDVPVAPAAVQTSAAPAASQSPLSRSPARRPSLSILLPSVLAVVVVVALAVLWLAGGRSKDATNDQLDRIAAGVADDSAERSGRAAGVGDGGSLPTPSEGADELPSLDPEASEEPVVVETERRQASTEATTIPDDVALGQPAGSAAAGTQRAAPGVPPGATSGGTPGGTPGVPGARSAPPSVAAEPSSIGGRADSVSVVSVVSAVSADSSGAATPSTPEVRLEIINQRGRGAQLRLRRGFEEMPRLLGGFEPPPPPAGGPSTIYEFDVRLDETGAVLEIKQQGDIADQDYAQALENALLRTRFSPGLRKDAPVRGQFRARILVD